MPEQVYPELCPLTSNVVFGLVFQLVYDFLGPVKHDRPIGQGIPGGDRGTASWQGLSHQR